MVIGRQYQRLLLLLTLSTLLAALSSFFREIVIAYRFGTSVAADAVSLIVFFGDTIFSVIGMAVASFGFLPILSEYRRTNQLDRGWAVVTAASIWILAIALCFCAVVFLAPNTVVSFLYPGFSFRQNIVTGEVIRWAAPALWLMIVAALVSGSLQVVNRLSATNASRILTNLGVIACLLLLYDYVQVHAFTVGLYIGVVCSVLVLWYLLLQSGYKKGSIALNDADLTGVIGLVVPGVLSLAINTVILGSAERFLLSNLPAGSIAMTSYAQRIMMSVGGISLAIQTTAFKSMTDPSVSREKHNALSASLDFGLFVLWPMSLFLCAYSELVIATFFRRGEFNHAAVVLTADALRWYALAVPPGFVLGVTVRACYAFFAPRISVFLTGSMAVIAVLADILLIPRFGYEAIPIGFLIGSAVSAILGLVFCYWMGWCGELRRILSHGAVQAGLALLGVVLLSSWRRGISLDAGRLSLLIHLFMAGLIYLSSYLIFSVKLGSPTAREIISSPLMLRIRNKASV